MATSEGLDEKGAKKLDESQIVLHEECAETRPSAQALRRVVPDSAIAADQGPRSC
jgi:hypothetical protein